MKQARRFARWLRLVVTCLAFVLGAPAPAVAAEALDRIVLVAEPNASEESRVEVATIVDVASSVAAEPPPPGIESPVFASRRYLTNCALLL
jgi:hypothetical protein